MKFIFQINLDKKQKRDTTNVYNNRDKPQYTTQHDGDYILVVHIEPDHADTIFEADISIEMRGYHGYLSVVDWPLLPFYGLMFGLYVAMGLGW